MASKSMQFALVIPPAIIRQYQKEFNVKITQKNYSEGLKDHGIPKDHFGGPMGAYSPSEKKITLYTKDVPSKYRTYKALFHELHHASGVVSEKAADTFAEKMLRSKRIRKTEDKESKSRRMMYQQTEQHKKKP